jgi:hypothetical protein
MIGDCEPRNPKDISRNKKHQLIQTEPSNRCGILLF